MGIAFFSIQRGEAEQPFGEFELITPQQAIAHSALHGGEIELYVGTIPSSGEPIIGLVFQGGIYTGYGLGPELLRATGQEEPWERLARTIIGWVEPYEGEPTMEFDGDGGVADAGPWLGIFSNIANIADL